MFILIWGKLSPVEQSWPVQLGSQLQVPVSARKAPCPEHWSMQEALGLSHPGPPHPTKQWHSPWTHTPRPEHVGSRQSTKRFQDRQCQTHHSPAASLFRRQPGVFIWACVDWQLQTQLDRLQREQIKNNIRLLWGLWYQPTGHLLLAHTLAGIFPSSHNENSSWTGKHVSMKWKL